MHCLFCFPGFCVPIVNWTFCFSFFKAAISLVYSDSNMEKEAKESKELPLDVSSVDLVLKVR